MSENGERRRRSPGIGQSAGRPAARARPARRSPSTPASRRSPTPACAARTSTALSTYPGALQRRRARLQRRRASREVQDALRLEPRLVRGRARDAGPARLGDQRLRRDRRRPRAPRALLPHACGSRRRRAAGARAGIGTGGGGGGASARVAASLQWTLPYGAASAAVLDRDVRAATLPRVRHHARADGVDRAQRARRNAATNPKAIYREPLTLDDYLAARMISTPFCLYDCDVPGRRQHRRS